jgi:hypothetical protein
MKSIVFMSKRNNPYKHFPQVLSTLAVLYTATKYSLALKMKVRRYTLSLVPHIFLVSIVLWPLFWFSKWSSFAGFPYQKFALQPQPIDVIICLHALSNLLFQNPVFSAWFFRPPISPVVFYTNFIHVSSPCLSTRYFHFFIYAVV